MQEIDKEVALFMEAVSRAKNYQELDFTKENSTIDTIILFHSGKSQIFAKDNCNELMRLGLFYYERWREQERSILNSKESVMRYYHDSSRKFREYEKALLCFYSCLELKIELRKDKAFSRILDELLIQHMQIFWNAPRAIVAQVNAYPYLFRCGLCRNGLAIARSHVFSRFLLELSTKASKSPKIARGPGGVILAQGPNDIAMCLPLLCKNCETSFSKYEGELAEILGDGSPITDFSYTNNLLLCIISLSFRYFFCDTHYAKTTFKEIITDISEYREILLKGREIQEASLEIGSIEFGNRSFFVYFPNGDDLEWDTSYYLRKFRRGGGKHLIARPESGPNANEFVSMGNFIVTYGFCSVILPGMFSGWDNAGDDECHWLLVRPTTSKEAVILDVQRKMHRSLSSFYNNVIGEVNIDPKVNKNFLEAWKSGFLASKVHSYHHAIIFDQMKNTTRFNGFQIEKIEEKQYHEIDTLRLSKVVHLHTNKGRYEYFQSFSPTKELIELFLFSMEEIFSTQQNEELEKVRNAIFQFLLMEAEDPTACGYKQKSKKESASHRLIVSTLSYNDFLDFMNDIKDYTKNQTQKYKIYLDAQQYLIQAVERYGETTDLKMLQEEMEMALSLEKPELSGNDSKETSLFSLTESDKKSFAEKRVGNLLKKSKIHRERGNDLFKQKEFKKALIEYNMSARYCDTKKFNNIDREMITKGLILALGNLSLTHYKMGSVYLALVDANLLLEYDPLNARGYVRRANIHIKSNDFEEAVADLKKAESLDVKHEFNDEILSAYEKVKAMAPKQKKYEKEFYQRMFK